MKERVGFIGLGAMGVGMAKNILENGYPLTILGHRRREPVERLTGLGAREVATAAEVAANSDIVIVCVTTSEVVEQLVFGDDGLLAGQTQPFMLIDCGTSDPGSTLKIGEALAQAGGSMLDVPLGRSAAAAEAGTLNMMAGGDEATFERARPLLETMSENLFHLGPLGTGHKIKLLNNAFSLSLASMTAEIVNVARKAGVEPALLNQVVTAGPMNSEFFGWMMAAALDDDETRLQFSLQNGLKDVGYFLNMAKQAHADASIPRAALDDLETCIRRGSPEDPVPAMVRLLA